MDRSAARFLYGGPKIEIGFDLGSTGMRDTFDQRSIVHLSDRMTQALLAREGFAAVAAIAAEALGCRVEVLVPRPGSEGSAGTPSERFVAELVAGRLPAWPAGVSEVVPIVVGGEVQGAVVAGGELGADAEEVLAATARAALTGIAILDTREEARRESASGLIAELLAGRRLEPAEIARRARRLGCDLGDGFLACVADGGTARGPAELIEALVVTQPGALVEVTGGIVHALVPGERLDTAALAEALGPGVIRAASAPYLDPADAARALDEALTLLALVRTSEVDDTDRQTWDSLRVLHGAYFNEPGRMQGFVERTVGELIRRDDAEDGRLQTTFWAYQQANCNMNVAAEYLDTHRHTVANRLRRIRQLTDLDPQRGYDRELLGLALRTYLVMVNSAAA